MERDQSLSQLAGRECCYTEYCHNIVKIFSITTQLWIWYYFYTVLKKYYWSSLAATTKRLWVISVGSFNHSVASASSNSSTNGPDSGSVAKTQHFVSHSFSPRPPVVQQPAKTLASDFFFIWFPFGAGSRGRGLKLTSNQPCRSRHQTVAANRVSWCSDPNANTTNYTTVTHTHALLLY